MVTAREMLEWYYRLVGGYVSGRDSRRRLFAGRNNPLTIFDPDMCMCVFWDDELVVMVEYILWSGWMGR